MKQSGWALSVGSAIGGAVLLFLGQVAIEEYKAHQQKLAAAGEAQMAEAAEQQKLIAAHEAKQQKLLDDMVAKFEELGTVSGHAGQFVQSGRGGSKADVAAVARHFRILSRHIANGRIRPSQAGPNYGGPIIYWRRGFQSLADRTSPAARHFSAEEREGFKLLATALGRLSVEIDLAQQDPFKDAANQPMPMPKLKEGAGER